jgi:hypothetical protein
LSTCNFLFTLALPAARERTARYAISLSFHKEMAKERERGLRPSTPRGKAAHRSAHRGAPLRSAHMRLKGFAQQKFRVFASKTLKHHGGSTAQSVCCFF